MQRLPAKKVRIKDVLNGKFFYGDKESLIPSYLVTRYGIKVGRVNLIGTIVDKFINDKENYLFFIIDDGTGEIRVKFFNESAKRNKSFEIGDLVLIIGKIREYLGEIYINGEIIRKIDDPNFETLRKLELARIIIQQKKLIKEMKSMRERMSEEEFEKYLKSKGIEKEVADVMLNYSETEEDYKQRLIYLISELDDGEGVEIDKILEISKIPPEIIESSISKLLDEGYIYEPSPGKFKIVEK